MQIAHLALSDGLIVKGQTLFEMENIVTGELVFSTSMCGYTELLTDPSYYGQILVLSHPEIGNYGVNLDDFQSDNIKVKAIVVRQLSSCASSYRSQLTLRDWLIREQIPVLFGVDTRALIAHIREKGAMMAALNSGPQPSLLHLVEQAQNIPAMGGSRLSPFVAVKEPKKYAAQVGNKAQFHVVVLDFGIKRAILRYLQEINARITLLPPEISAEEVWAHNPDGIFLSNGPGDPTTETDAIKTVKALLGKIPIFGVCLGHQILAQALQQKIYKLKFGHRGSNQAVKYQNKAILTTAQNHGFAALLSPDYGYQDAINISDGTNEGLAIKELKAFSVQFHPEGAPGPVDAAFYFANFAEAMKDHRDEKNRVPEILAHPIS